MEINQNQSSPLEKLVKHLDRCETLLRKAPKITKEMVIQNQVHTLRLINSVYGNESVIINRFKELPKLLSTSSSEAELKNRFERHLYNLQSTIDFLYSARFIVTGVHRIFVGHGRNTVWHQVVRHIKDELKIGVEDYETGSHASEHIIDILKGLLNRCDTAVIVMTPDDQTTEGKMRARQNVIHEAGLFQGRYGFNRVFIIQQTDVEGFSNKDGHQVIPFTKDIREAFYELDRALEKLNEI